MEATCVRVPRETGESVRRELAALDLVADNLAITVEDEWLYIPVTEPAAVPEGYELVDHDLPVRERQQRPADLVGFEPSYERLGDVVILDEEDDERARAIARAVVDSDLPVRSVVNKASAVRGEERVRDWTVLAVADGADDADEGGDQRDRQPTETIHREYGCAYRVDIAEVYFSPRLATERHRVAEQVSADERAFDMFAGVGPFVVPFARRGATCVGVDVNERAVELLRENAERNGVADRVTAIRADVREVAPEYEGWADRIVMNLPHSADAFLDAAIQLAGDDCVVHYYDIQHEDDPFGPGERAIREAVAGAYEVDVETRHVVRSYAPHELNVCLDVRLRRRR